MTSRDISFITPGFRLPEEKNVFLDYVSIIFDDSEAIYTSNAIISLKVRCLFNYFSFGSTLEVKITKMIT